jgi:hypothetical protein
MTRLHHPYLVRLDAVATHLSRRSEVVAVLGLGSAGQQTDRFDDHSDLDVFVVVDEGCQQQFVDAIGWLAAAGTVAWSFLNEPNGRKVLFTDGLFVEYAVFSVAELARVPFAGARVLWQRHHSPTLPAESHSKAGPAFDTIEFHLGEAVTNLLVGLHRELRGERLTACRFIQVYAVDRAISLLRLTGAAPQQRDVFDPTRRVEAALDASALPLSRLVPGYEHNVAAAAAMIEWLRARFEIDGAVNVAIDDLVATAKSSGETTS